MYDLLQLNEEHNKNILIKENNKNILQPCTQTLPIKNVQIHSLFPVNSFFDVENSQHCTIILLCSTQNY